MFSFTGIQTMTDFNASTVSEKKSSYKPYTDYNENFFNIPSVISQRKRAYGDDVFKFFNLKNNQKRIPWKGSKASLYSQHDHIKTYNLFNSIITDLNNVPLSIGNTCPMDNKSFCKLLQSDFKENRQHFLFKELIEGTEITLFAYKGNWHFASKYNFADKKTIDLFVETAEAVGLKPKHLNDYYCYNFVFQHPEVAYVHKFVHHAIYLISTFTVNKKDKIIKRLFDNDIELPGVKIPKNVHVNHVKIDLVLREWKGKLPKHVWDNDPHEGRFMMHPSTYRGVCITHLPSGLTTTATNYHFRGLYRDINGCSCCSRQQCTCNMKGVFMDKSMSGNISKAFQCPKSCSYCSNGRSYICTVCGPIPASKM
jgi:hypothetical protein